MLGDFFTQQYYKTTQQYYKRSTNAVAVLFPTIELHQMLDNDCLDSRAIRLLSGFPFTDLYREYNITYDIISQ